MTYDQHDTPYLDAALRYRDAGFTPFHTPGHKLGKGAPADLREFLGEACLDADVAMAGGVEDTRESTQLIRLAEDYAAEAWGADRAWFLVNGSSSGVHALMLTLCGPGDTVIVPRNAHKSMLGGLIFTGATPVYMEPAIDPQWGIPLNVTPAQAQAALAAHPEARAIVRHLAHLQRPGRRPARHRRAGARAGVPFVTDQAWGPHLRFCDLLPADAMSAGADAAVVSTHKLISGLTQTSVLMTRGSRVNVDRLSAMVHLTQTTSPQVLMYVSIDAARRQMATQGQQLWAAAVHLADWARAALNELPGVRCLDHDVLARAGVAEFDATRLTVSACDLGLSGYELETALRDDYRIAVEAADPLSVVLNVTFGDGARRPRAAGGRLPRPGGAPARGAGRLPLCQHAGARRPPSRARS